MASGIFAKILQEELGTTKVSQEAILRVATKSKSLGLASTLTLRAKEAGEELSESDVSNFEDAAEEYVERLVTNMYRKSLDDLIDDEFSEDYTDSVLVEGVGGLRDAGGRFISAMSLVRLLNSTLYLFVKELMGSPRLNWQTGRLAHSGKVTTLSNIGPNLASITFTYMLYPYQVFEPSSGSPLASEARSPSALFTDAIHLALRELLSVKSKVRFIVTER